ncbi:MAG: hypothetical protein HGB17_17870 [Syntrophobacteraceae bacterium]|nr:hypothetical protein [Syntrophobacteraceae bacterium]
MRQEMRRWRLHLRSDKAIDDLARMWNSVLRGWIPSCNLPFRRAMSLGPASEGFKHGQASNRAVFEDNSCGKVNLSRVLMVILRF